MIESAAKAPLIEAKDVSCKLGGRDIISGINLTVEQGEYLCILGPNGAGKTTFIKLLAGLLPTAKGDVRLSGRPIAEYDRKSLARIVSYVPQAYGKVMPFLVGDFLLMGRYAYLDAFRAAGSVDKKAVENAFLLTDTGRFRDRRMSTLSGGELQKVFVAAALVQEAPLLLLDEPGSFLDPHHQTEIFNILYRLNRNEGVTIISVTHNINQAATISGRIMALVEGSVAYLGCAEKFMTKEVLEKVYKQDFVFTTHPTTGARVALTEQTL